MTTINFTPEKYRALKLAYDKAVVEGIKKGGAWCPAQLLSTMELSHDCYHTA